MTDRALKNPFEHTKNLGQRGIPGRVSVKTGSRKPSATSGEFSEQLSEFVTQEDSIYAHASIQARLAIRSIWPRRPKTNKKKSSGAREGGNTATNTLQCVTVRLPGMTIPHPLPGLSFTAFGRKGVGGGGVRPSRCMICTGPRSSPLFPKPCNDGTQDMGREMSCLPTPKSF